MPPFGMSAGFLAATSCDQRRKCEQTFCRKTTKNSGRFCLKRPPCYLFCVAWLKDPNFCEHFIHVAHRNDFQPLLDLGVDIGKIALIFLRNEHRRDAGALCSHELFRQAADGGDGAAQRDFAGHGVARRYGASGDQAGDGRCQRDAGGRAVFWHCAFWHMDVQVAFFVLRPLLRIFCLDQAGYGCK